MFLIVINRYMCIIMCLKTTKNRRHPLVCMCVAQTVLILFLFFRGDHIVPNFAELWPQNNPNMGRKKRVGIEYYMSALQHHGLSGHLPQPENFTTCGKQPIEIAQYNSPIEVNVVNIPLVLHFLIRRLCNFLQSQSGSRCWFLSFDYRPKYKLYE